MVEGLIWTSNQCDPDDAIMFFGNRVSSEVFDTLEVRLGDSNSSFRNDILTCEKRSNIRIKIRFLEASWISFPNA